MSATENPIRDEISKAISEHEIILFMKGRPEQPMCGFSARTVAALDAPKPADEMVAAEPMPAVVKPKAKRAPTKAAAKAEAKPAPVKPAQPKAAAKTPAKPRAPRKTAVKS